MEKLEGKVAVITARPKASVRGSRKYTQNMAPNVFWLRVAQKFWSWQKSYGNRGMKPLAFRQDVSRFPKCGKAGLYRGRNLRTGGYPGQ